MKKVLSVFSVAFALFFFTGCNEKKEVKTVEFFEANPEELKQTLEKCSKDKTRNAREEAECTNAKLVKEDQDFKKRMKTPSNMSFYYDDNNSTK
ncbi:EexN family lipoprotein [Campylobacter ureolyticus]|uniref:EexN family lipoprotein n=2 Tax=Campylobacter ureolyticus TaxID=827 RepID=UPI0022B2BBEF|nr:EexN family lipoprotein [Campylobacter ureolyticus]MCZ6166665.1 EexN family lipoprotein [Campylobacter ureolyticus]MCZ6168140.1 EexN family lipoprotein [Campylobacter ureolyticus]